MSKFELSSLRPWQKVKVGDRVSWHANPERVGTIKEIYLTEHPFYVVWDNGKDDWYKGEWLVLLEGQSDGRRNGA